MWRRILILGLSLWAGNAFAQNCSSIHAQATKQSGLMAPPWEMKVVGQKGFKTYFHQAPDDKCKIANLFLIPKDYVLAHRGVKIKNTDWVYVMYMRKNGSEVYGWMKEKDFKFLGKLGG